MDWPRTLAPILQQQPCVLVTLNLVLGSAPRESGCRMIVTQDRAHGSIGGGNLEYMATQRARDMLQESARARQLHQPFGLGPAFKQCCGGAVTLHFEVFPGPCPAWLENAVTGLDERLPQVLATAIDRAEPLHLLVQENESPPAGLPAEILALAQSLLSGEAAPGGEAGDNPAIHALETDGETWWLERLTSHKQPLVLFGAGHVGQEVARLLQRMPFEVSWVDSRPGVFPPEVAENIHPVETGSPSDEVAKAPAGSVFVVMTHSHELDEDICHEILRRGDFAWLGLIGSETKRKRFVQRLNRRGIERDLLERLCCPIGLVGLHGKEPATIALSLVAQLMMERPWTRANN